MAGNIMNEDRMEVLSPHDDEHRTYILVTGANSGLGFAICRRLIDEFVQTRPSFESLTLIPTTRDVKKAKDTVAKLQKHLRKLDEKWEENLSNRVTIQPESVDLTSLSSVWALATKLADSIPHLDTIICNAGFGGTTGIDWPRCLWSMATSLTAALTYPQYKISGIGYTTTPQLPFSAPKSADDELISIDSQSSSNGKPSSENQPPLGKVFTSNVFGHYLLNHRLLPLLSAAPDAGRIIWVSSLEAYPHVFHPNDLQALTTDKAYESSKRLTDILVLTSSLASTAPFVKRFLTPPILTPSNDDDDDTNGATGRGIQLQDNESPSDSDSPPRINLTDHEQTSLSHSTTTPRTPALYLTHPGICSTNFVPLPLILQLGMTLAFLLARLLGSPWHTVSAWKGAKAPVWIALAQREEMEDVEVQGGRGKWGSCVDWRGREGVRRTGVRGWGVGGRVRGGEKEGGGGGDEREEEEEEMATREERVEFEELGRGCWKEMETLRVAWEARLKGEE